MRFLAIFSAVLVTWAVSPAIAQDQQTGGRVAESVVGQAGQRQTAEQIGTRIEPMARIESRITNRVQSRIRNRIDENYNPRADATSLFSMATESARTAGKRRPR